MESFSTLLGIFGAIGALGGAVAYFSSGRASKIIELQKEEIEAVYVQNKRLEDEKRLWQVEKTELNRRLTDLEKQLEILHTIISGRPEIEKLALTVEKNHQELTMELSNIAKAIQGKS